MSWLPIETAPKSRAPADALDADKRRPKGHTMSRSGYSDGLEPLELGRWRGRVASAIRGKRGQAFLKEALAALDALPEKRLIKGDLVASTGLPFREERSVCLLGAVGLKRSLDMTSLDPHAAEDVASAFGIAEVMAREITWVNDEARWRETPEERFERVRAWVVAQINDGASP